MKYLLLILLVSCIANNPSQIKQKDFNVSKSTESLHKRGVTQETREDYIKFIGYNYYPTAVKEAFLNGKVSTGMSRIMITMLYGEPNRARDSTWIYIVEGASMLLEIKFQHDTVSVIGFSFK